MDQSILIIVLIILICLLLIAIVFVVNKFNLKLKNVSQMLDDERQFTSSLQSDNNKLSRFRSCVNADEYAVKLREDADLKAKEIIATAENNANALRTAAQTAAHALQNEANKLKEQSLSERDRIIEQAKEEAKEMTSERRQLIAQAKQKAEELISEANKIQIEASRHAAEIIEKANDKAKTIAGDAFEMAKNVQMYKEQSEALRNIIEGYGDRYLKPSDSVLDGLAEEFGFTEAGRELARTRSLCKEMVEEGLAASSEYVEPNRKNTACAFIIDAFNGKVDSILSTVKATNIGILEKKVRDAYTLVNMLGVAFRNTKITPEYFKERMSELRWAAAVIALKDKQREEQRAIKEQIREEERARREYERAIRDAEKQEAAIKKAIEKATAQLSKANEEQKSQYEAQLQDLQNQLSEAETRNQRALSMAQQTRSGHVYIISNIGSFGDDVYKIGMTRRLEPLDRVRELGDASVPFPFDVHAMIFSEDAPALETELHKLFARNQVNKVNPRKEFFRLSIAEIREYIDKKDIQVQWTMKAEAAQYRETLALEEAFKNNAHLENQWAENQDQEFDPIESDNIEENDAD